jgi:hypothetical protein
MFAVVVDNGQLGTGSTTQLTAMPGSDAANTGAITIVACDYTHTCVVTTSGGVRCWLVIAIAFILLCALRPACSISSLVCLLAGVQVPVASLALA